MYPYQEQAPAPAPIPSQYEMEMARRAEEDMAGRQMARQVASMRQVSPYGILQDPRFVQYQANIIRQRIYGQILQGLLNGEHSARELANVEDYLNSSPDSELVQNYPFMFDYGTDGANYMMELERQQMADREYPIDYGNAY